MSDTTPAPKAKRKAKPKMPPKVAAPVVEAPIVEASVVEASVVEAAPESASEPKAALPVSAKPVPKKAALKLRPQRSLATAIRLPASSARTERRMAELARRRGLVLWTKRALPLVALLLLAVVIAWPEMRRDKSMIAPREKAAAVEPASGELSNGRYNGLNENGEPFTVTAVTAHQRAADRIDLGSPVGDISLRGGSWLQGKGQRGVFNQVAGQLDLEGDVSLYRDDGTKMETDTATIDTKSGAATSADKVHAEGPFGTLDAQGFTLLDRGNVIQFTGPGRLVLEGAQK